MTDSNLGSSAWRGLAGGASVLLMGALLVGGCTSGDQADSSSSATPSTSSVPDATDMGPPTSGRVTPRLVNAEPRLVTDPFGLVTSVVWVEPGSVPLEPLELGEDTFGVVEVLLASTDTRMLIGLWGGGCSPRVAIRVVAAEGTGMSLEVVVAHPPLPPEPIQCGDVLQAWVVEITTSRPVSPEEVTIDLEDLRLTTPAP
jgi:hypothetical protein